MKTKKLLRAINGKKKKKSITVKNKVASHCYGDKLMKEEASTFIQNCTKTTFYVFSILFVNEHC